MILPIFHMGGMIDWLMLQLKMLVKKMMPFSPKCFNIIDGEMVVGPLGILSLFNCSPGLLRGDDNGRVGGYFHILRGFVAPGVYCVLN